MTLATERTYTLDQAAELAGQVEHRIEVDEGRIRPVAPPDSEHSTLVTRLIAWLVAGGHRPEHVLAGAGLAVGPASGRCPDLMLLDPTRGPLPQSVVWIPARHARLVVEVVSPGSQEVDRDVKPAEYAAAGIPYLWLIERASTGYPSPDPGVCMYRLTGRDTYRSLGTEPFSRLLSSPAPFRS